MKFKLLIALLLLLISLPFLIFKYNKELSKKYLEYYLSSKFSKLNNNNISVAINHFSLQQNTFSDKLSLYDVSLHDEIRGQKIAHIGEIQFDFKLGFLLAKIIPIKATIINSTVNLPLPIGNKENRLGKLETKEIVKTEDKKVPNSPNSSSYSFDDLFLLVASINTDLIVENLNFQGNMIKSGFLRANKRKNSNILNITINESNTSSIELEITKAERNSIVLKFSDFNLSQSVLSSFLQDIESEVGSFKLEDFNIAVNGYAAIDLTEKKFSGEVTSFTGQIQNKIKEIGLKTALVSSSNDNNTSINNNRNIIISNDIKVKESPNINNTDNTDNITNINNISNVNDVNNNIKQPEANNENIEFINISVPDEVINVLNIENGRFLFFGNSNSFHAYSISILAEKGSFKGELSYNNYISISSENSNNRSNSNSRLYIEGLLENIKCSQILDFWPVISSPEARAWYKNNIKTGLLKSANLKIDTSKNYINIEDLFFSDVETEISYKNPGQNLESKTVQSSPSVINIKAAEGYLSLVDKKLNVNVTSAQFLNSKIRNFNIQAIQEEGDIKGVFINLFGKLEDTSKNLLLIANKFAAEELAKVKNIIKLEEIEGGATAEVAISLMPDGSDRREININLSNAKLDNFYNSFNLYNGNLNINVNNEGVFLKGEVITDEENINIAVSYAYLNNNYNNYNKNSNLENSTIVNEVKGNNKGGTNSNNSKRHEANVLVNPADNSDNIEVKLQGIFTIETLKKAKFFPNLSFVSEKIYSDIILNINKNGDFALKGSGELSKTHNTLLPLLNWRNSLDKKAKYNIDLVKTGESTVLNELEITGENLYISGHGRITNKETALNFGKILVNDSALAIKYYEISSKKHLTIEAAILDLSSLNLQNLKDNLNWDKNDKQSEISNLNIEAKAARIRLKNNLSLLNTNLAYTKEKVKLTGAFDNNVILVFNYNQDIALDFEVTNAGTLLRALDITDTISGGHLALNINMQPGRNKPGILLMDDFSVKNAPILAQLLSLASLTGILDILNGEGIHFNQLRAPFKYGEDIITFAESWAESSSLGISFKGPFSLSENSAILRGNVIPFYRLSKLIWRIPLIGKIITGGRRGIFAAEYTLVNRQGKYNVSVNPFTTLTPTAMRGLLEIFN